MHHRHPDDLVLHMPTSSRRDGGREKCPEKTQGPMHSRHRFFVRSFFLSILLWIASQMGAQDRDLDF